MINPTESTLRKTMFVLNELVELADNDLKQ